MPARIHAHNDPCQQDDDGDEELGLRNKIDGDDADVGGAQSDAGSFFVSGMCTPPSRRSKRSGGRSRVAMMVMMWRDDVA
jgi:hypothetical protein